MLPTACGKGGDGPQIQFQNCFAMHSTADPFAKKLENWKSGRIYFGQGGSETFCNFSSFPVFQVSGMDSHTPNLTL
jgi:hypothetical protein